MRKTIAEAILPGDRTLAELDVDERRNDLTSRPPTQGRRASARRRVLLSALVVDLSTDMVASCRLENVSDSGARIRLAGARYLPQTFWLIAVTSGLAYSVSIVWRKDEVLGVEVVSSVDLTDADDKTERQLQQIWRARR
jgi:hypothetical protein